MHAWSHRALVVALVGALVACSEPELPAMDGPGAEVVESFVSPELAAPADAPVALVVDEGFDLGLEALAGRVLAAYHVECAPEPPTSPPLEATPFAEAKASMLATFQKRDERCRLVPGLTLRRSSWLDTLEDERNDWNEAFDQELLHELPDAYYRRFNAALYGDGKYTYHGTYVASIVAAAAPKAKLVVVETDLLSAGERASCPTRGTMDRWIELYRDPEIAEAYMARPPSRFDAELFALERRYGVTYRNQSFGSDPAAVRLKDCPGLPWNDFYDVVTKLSIKAERARDALFPGDETLVFRSAGNASAVVDTSRDALYCEPLDDRRYLTIGAYDPDGVASFSNSGGCVDVYAPGVAVLAWAPKGYRVLFGGTSAAAPLAMAMAMRTFGPTGSRGARRSAFLERFGQSSPPSLGRFVPLAKVPTSVLYGPPWGFGAPK